MTEYTNLIQSPATWQSWLENENQIACSSHESELYLTQRVAVFKHPKHDRDINTCIWQLQCWYHELFLKKNTTKWLDPSILYFCSMECKNKIWKAIIVNYFWNILTIYTKAILIKIFIQVWNKGFFFNMNHDNPVSNEKWNAYIFVLVSWIYFFKIRSLARSTSLIMKWTVKQIILIKRSIETTSVPEVESHWGFLWIVPIIQKALERNISE